MSGAPARLLWGALVVIAVACTNEEPTVYVDECAGLPTIRFGLDFTEFEVDSGAVEPGTTLSELLDPLGIGPGLVAELTDPARGNFDARRMQEGSPWWILYERDGQRTPAWFIFQDDRRAASVFRLCDSVWVRREELPVDTVLNRARGIVDENLYTDIEQAGAPSALAVMLANVYAYTIDFTRLQEGDQFDVLYEREYVNGEPVGNPRILACHFIHKGKDRPAYIFEGSSGRGYYDGDGNSMKRAFLKSPVEFSRISSRFNKKRFHPVLHRVKAHLGTDYSAPHGTPILAVGDGVVTHSAYTSGNGNYVKIRHNGTYETQYLHMSRQAVRKGERVSQGQIIGYVGSTGLSTGPHVCFRFWKNGVQVDHLAEDIPSAGPVAAADRAAFEAFRDRCARLLGPTGEEDCATSE